MYQDTWAVQQNVGFSHKQMLRDAEASHMANESHRTDEPEKFNFHQAQRRLVAVAVALVTVLGVVAVL